jgi:scyllo-inositol 2-dehydrogenase (NADP+)
MKKSANYITMQTPINTAILSYGMSGEIFHAPLLTSLPEFQLTTVVQRSAKTASNDYPHVKVVPTVDDVFRDPGIELVIVNTPNETHFEYASAALNAGKHVVVEKPFTVTSDEAMSLINLAKAKERMLSVFQNRRWDGDFLTVGQVLKSGKLGQVVEYQAYYDRFRNYIEETSWKEKKRPGTGIVFNLGSHMLDQAYMLFGMPLYVDARIGIQRPGGSVDDFYDIRLEYATHLAIIKSSYLVKETLPRYIIHGTHGSFVKTGLDPQEQDLKEKKDPNDPWWGMEEKVFWGKLNTVSGAEFVETVPGDYAAFYRNINDVIRNNGELSVKPEEALDVIRIIEACYESSREKKAIKL